jgi:hypothetical protein
VIFGSAGFADLGIVLRLPKGGVGRELREEIEDVALTDDKSRNAPVEPLILNRRSAAQKLGARLS